MFATKLNYISTNLKLYLVFLHHEVNYWGFGGGGDFFKASVSSL